VTGRAGDPGNDVVTFVDEREVRARVEAVFDAVRALVAGMLPAAEVEHVGSTAVPGAVTKGDLDVCVRVGAGELEAARRILGARFAANVGSERTASLDSFVDESWPVSVGIQLVLRGGPEDFFIRWRDLLRASPDLLAEYNRLKRAWHGRSHDGYRAAKSALIERTLGQEAR
jgi:GrpB-like predicted nucleotidyltransferase (UPF0157 family)